MKESKEEESAQIDWKWEYKKLDSRIEDVWDELSIVKKQIKSTNMKIARLKFSITSGEPEEDEEEEIPPGGPRFDDMTLEERALIYSELLDKYKTQP